VISFGPSRKNYKRLLKSGLCYLLQGIELPLLNNNTGIVTDFSFNKGVRFPGKYILMHNYLTFISLRTEDFSGGCKRFLQNFIIIRREE
jgi:hypothetical protein